MTSSQQLRKALGCSGSVPKAEPKPFEPMVQLKHRYDLHGPLSGSYCDHCGEWIPIGLLSAVKHFEKSERCMVHTISDGLKGEQPMIAGPKYIEAIQKFIEESTTNEITARKGE